MLEDELVHLLGRSPMRTNKNKVRINRLINGRLVV